MSDPTPPVIHLQSTNYSKHLFEDVPFHQLIEKPLDNMNEAELEALLKTTRAARVSPAVRKSMRVKTSKSLASNKKQITVTEDLSHLL